MEKGVITKLQEFENFIGLFLVDHQNYSTVTDELLRYLTSDRHMPGVYITVNKPFSVIKSNLENAKIDVEMIIFIDAVTQMNNFNVQNHENCVYLQSPRDLSDISIAMTEALEAIDYNEKFVFFDSLNTLLIYSDPATVARFIHFIIGKIRSYNVNGIILSLKKDTDPKLISKISQFCDFTITTNEDSK